MGKLGQLDICVECEGISFFEVLKEIRLERGLTFEMLGDLTGWSRNKVWRFETKKIPRKQGDVDKLIEALHCNAIREARLRKAYLCDVLRERGIC